jgi:anaerobic ribonucleoside-triphosphate reductase
MPRGRPRITFCRACGETVDPADLSWTKQCPACGEKALTENVHGLANHSGPAFERWRRAMAASVGGVLLDDVLPRP